MSKQKLIEQKLSHLWSKIPPEKLVAVSKYSPVEDIITAYNFGQRNFGENRLNDLLEKSSQLKELKDISWHFIGNLQSNKLNKLLTVNNLNYIHSIDSMKLLKKLINQIKERSNKIHFLLQINTSNEIEKNGVSTFEELIPLVEYYLQSKTDNCTLVGLMTMGRIRTDNLLKDAEKSYSDLTKMKKKLEQQFNLMPLKLSMGMSRDYEVALQYHADFIRIGSYIFK